MQPERPPSAERRPSNASNARPEIKASRDKWYGPARHDHDVRPAFLECTACSKRYEVRLVNTCDCGGPLFAPHERAGLGTDKILPREDLLRDAPLPPPPGAANSSRGGGAPPPPP